MRLIIARLFLAIAVSLVWAHNLTPHHHEHKFEGYHHTGNDEDDRQHHKVFSLGQLDEDFFTPQHGLETEGSPLLAEIPAHTPLNIERIPCIPTPVFSLFQVYPPPDIYTSCISRRGPPAA